MKKVLSIILSVLLAASLLLSFSSCGKTEPETVSDEMLLANAPEVFAVALNIKINPNILLYIGDNGDIIRCEFLNEDAEKMIEKRLVEGRLLKDAMVDIVTEAINQGFLKDGGDVELYVVKSNLSQFDMDNIVNVAEDVARQQAKDKGIEININRHQADDAVNPDETNLADNTEPQPPENPEENPPEDNPPADTNQDNGQQNQGGSDNNGGSNQSNSNQGSSDNNSGKKEEGCSVCWGSGKCGYCGAKGRITCEVCHGSGHETCSQCGGECKMKCSCGDGLCSLCHGAKYITCEECGGNGDSNCPSCHGTHKQGCYRCESTGKCLQCNGTKYTGTCNQCNGTGYTNCGPCNGTGITDCNQCHGSGKCPACNGTGKKPD